MKPPRAKLILWTGPKHSGKTTAVLKLVSKARSAGFSVAGLVAPAVYHGRRLTGFDVVDIHTKKRTTLSRLGGHGPQIIGEFALTAEGLALGRKALGPAAGTADMVIVDEFGPLELAGGGWREAVDELLRSTGGLGLLVVRDGSVDAVRRLYALFQPLIVPAAGGADALKTVIDVLRVSH
ncbi:MAG: nucleoside-triphosphatase [Planctomycetota bacterium]|nr:nucleoside-triphosphatase [Planctomycetota bacterium]